MSHSHTPTYIGGYTHTTKVSLHFVPTARLWDYSMDCKKKNGNSVYMYYYTISRQSSSGNVRPTFREYSTVKHMNQSIDTKAKNRWHIFEKPSINQAKVGVILSQWIHWGAPASLTVNLHLKCKPLAYNPAFLFAIYRLNDVNNDFEMNYTCVGHSKSRQLNFYLAIFSRELTKYRSWIDKWYTEFILMLLKLFRSKLIPIYLICSWIWDCVRVSKKNQHFHSFIHLVVHYAKFSLKIRWLAWFSSLHHDFHWNSGKYFNEAIKVDFRFCLIYSWISKESSSLIKPTCIPSNALNVNKYLTKFFNHFKSRRENDFSE